MEYINEDDLDEDMESELEHKARNIAMERFEEHFKGELLKKPYAPQAVVALEDGVCSRVLRSICWSSTRHFKCLVQHLQMRAWGD